MSQNSETGQRLKDIQKTNEEILEALERLQAKQLELKKRREKQTDLGNSGQSTNEAGTKDEKSTEQKVVEEGGNHAPAAIECRLPVQKNKSSDEPAIASLTNEMLDYVRLLRCKQVNQHQDNRLCYKFDIKPNRGTVVQKRHTRRVAAQTGHSQTPQKVLEKKKTMVKRSSAIETVANTVPTTPLHQSMMEIPKEMPQPDMLKLITSGFAVAMNPYTGDHKMISREEVQQVVAEAKALDMPPIILEFDPQDQAMKLTSGKEILQQVVAAADELSELEQSGEFMKKVLHMYSDKESIPIMEMMELWGDMVSNPDAQPLVAASFQMFQSTVDSAVKDTQPKTTKVTPSLKQSQTKELKVTTKSNKSKPQASAKSHKELKSSNIVDRRPPASTKKAQEVKSPNIGARKTDSTVSEEKQSSSRSASSAEGSRKTRSSTSASHTQPQSVVLKDSMQTGQAGAPVEEAEPVFINENLWTEIANQQIENGAPARSVREKGMDTIMCLDLSDSMQGEPWKLATDFIKGFIEGIQNTTLRDHVYEHVGLVTFGSETVVQQHMTCDYVEVLRKLAKLKPGGPSPLYAGLTMVYAALNGAGAHFVSNGYKICPRVYLLTDGRPTPAKMIAGPDRCQKLEEDMEKSKVAELLATLCKSFHITMNVVPLGACDVSFLERLASLSGGKLIAPDDWEPQTRSFKNYLTASQCAALGGLGSPDIISLLMGSASESDKLEIEEFLKTRKKNEGDSDSDTDELPDYPALGSRVKRSVFGEIEDIGTVTKHMSDGHIGVTWDKPNSHGTIREKVRYSESIRNVVACQEPRILKDEFIAVGCRVTRGKDWRYTDQDGGAGNLGSVYNVDPQGIIKVRWDIGNKNSYRFGQDGIYFDVEIVEERPKPSAKPEQPKDPVDLIEEMNRKNTANSQNIMDCMTRKESAGETNSFERQANIRNTQESAPKERDKNTSKPVTHSAGSNTQTVRKSDTTEERPPENIVIKKDTSSSAPRQSEGPEDLGARPKVVLSPAQIKWRWNNNGVWQIYPPEICNKIETSFRRNPKGTALVKVGTKVFRIVFTRMEQVNTETKEKFPVTRR